MSTAPNKTSATLEDLYPSLNSEIFLDQQDVGFRRQGIQFLSFPLSFNTEAMIAVDQLSAVLKVQPHQITPIPGMDPWVLGVYNWRGTITWVIDLAAFLGQPPLFQQSGSLNTLSVLIGCSTSTHAFLGLAISQVGDMHWCQPDDIASAPATAVTQGLAPYLRGHTLTSQGDIALILDMHPLFERLSL
ncbi:MAG: purine-binding chemotaxis protein CheW [Synechococcaceae cyanobacterium SM2_3_2]|nr:purine-binding chemotaxis protein CheW [Synechococcaceae cyanobacterium SM2_3_2]